MIRKERRQHFFIDKPLQLRYLLTISLALVGVLLVSLAHLYFGIWGGVLDAFSNEKIRNDLLTASRLQEYEEARHPLAFHEGEPASILSYFRQAERLSTRQQEIFKELLDQTNRNLVGKLVLLLGLIAWGSVFLSHKIAGPLYRFQKIFEGIIQGDLTPRCQLRKFDEAKPAAETLNRSLECLDSALSRLKRIVREDARSSDPAFSRMNEELSKFKTST